MKTISSRDSARILGFGLLVSIVSGCTTTVYDTYTPAPPPPTVEYVPAPPPPPPDQPQPEYAPPAETVIVIRAESDFYAPLGRYGHWVDMEGYGRCWVPDGVDRDWRPYTQGRWERTDNGWYWSSDEPWGWATCHYGRWFLDPRFGWVWLPRTEWAPAWVAWRDGDDYSGWAPLPPRARFRADGALERDDDVDPHSFVFVEKRHLMEQQRPQTVIVNNITVIQKTVNVTKVTVVNKTVINEGPSPDAVARAAGHQIHVVPAHTLRTEREAPVAVKEHLRTESVPVGRIPDADHNRPHAPENETHNPRPEQPPQPKPQPRPIPENTYVTPQQPGHPQQPGIYVPPVQPRPPQDQPKPHPVIPEQNKNDQNAVKQQREHEQNPNKPLNQPRPNQPPNELKHPPQPPVKPELHPENNQPQNHVVPNPPRPEQNVRPQPPGQPENGPARPHQEQIPPPQKPEQKNPAQKPHPPEDKGHHSSTNAPPQQK